MFVKSCHHDRIHLLEQSWCSHRCAPFNTSYLYGIGHIYGIDWNCTAHIYLYGRKLSIEDAAIWHDIRQCRTECFHIHCHENVSATAAIYRFGNMLDVVLCQLCTWHHLCSNRGRRNKRKRIKRSKWNNWNNIITQRTVHIELNREYW